MDNADGLAIFGQRIGRQPRPDFGVIEIARQAILVMPGQFGHARAKGNAITQLVDKARIERRLGKIALGCLHPACRIAYHRIELGIGPRLGHLGLPALPQCRIDRCQCLFGFG